MLSTLLEVETTAEHAANLKSSQSPAPIAVSAQFPAELMVCQYCSPPLLLVVQTGNKTAMPSRGGFMRARRRWWLRTSRKKEKYRHL